MKSIIKTQLYSHNKRGCVCSTSFSCLIFRLNICQCSQCNLMLFCVSVHDYDIYIDFTMGKNDRKIHILLCSISYFIFINRYLPLFSITVILLLTSMIFILISIPYIFYHTHNLTSICMPLLNAGFSHE